MDFAEIIYEKKDRVAKVTMNRPEKMNAWTPKMGAESILSNPARNASLSMLDARALRALRRLFDAESNAFRASDRERLTVSKLRSR